MILFVENLNAGNAVKLIVKPQAGATKWRLLRRTDDAFAGESDPGAVLVCEDDKAYSAVVDSTALVNGVTYYYRFYALVAGIWLDASGQSVVSVPAATYNDETTDVLSFVLSRVDLGIKTEVARGTLKPESGKIPVHNAPPVFGATPWPTVSIHLDSDGPRERFLAEDMAVAEHVDGQWIDGDGWLAETRLSIVGWSINPTQRINLRKSLRAILTANLPVFEAVGMETIEFNFRDDEDLNSYPAPVYMTHAAFSCLSPVIVTGAWRDIDDVVVTHTPIEEVSV